MICTNIELTPTPEQIESTRHSFLGETAFEDFVHKTRAEYTEKFRQRAQCSVAYRNLIVFVNIFLETVIIDAKLTTRGYPGNR